MSQREITLGLGEAEVDVPVYAQSVPYLVNRIAKFGMRLQATFAGGGDVSIEQLPLLLGEHTYGALTAVMPTVAKRMPEHVFRGFPTHEAMLAGDYSDEVAQQQAPTLPQIREAFRAAYEVNGIDLIEVLFGRILDPTVLRRAINAHVADYLSTTLPSSPPESGASDPTSSGTTDPPSTATADEPSRG